MPQLRITKQITKRENQSTEKYLQEVKTLPLISAEEEVELAKKIKQGDEKAKEKLILANLRFVISVAKQYPSSELSLNDLIQSGNEGLIKASGRFDETLGFKFISYGVHWIRQRIVQTIQEKGRFIRIPLNRATAIQKINKMRRDLVKEYQREPTAEEIANRLSMDIEAVSSIIQTNTKTISLDAPFAQEDSSNYLEILPDKHAEAPDENLMQESTKEEVQRLFSKLDPRARKILTYYFMKEMTLDQIAKLLGISRERIRQIKEKALKELRTMVSYR